MIDLFLFLARPLTNQVRNSNSPRNFDDISSDVYSCQRVQIIAPETFIMEEFRKILSTYKTTSQKTR